MTDWMTVPECAEALGVPLSKVREYLRDRHLISTRRGENNAVYLPAGQLIDGESGSVILATVRGTVLLLSDAGMSDDDIVAWLLADNEELGMTPLAALREGRRAHVRRVAQTAL